MDKSKPSYYGILPAHVRYDNYLPPMARIMYAEITALSNKDGYCSAGNDYFAKLYDVSTVTVSRWISKLGKQGHILIDADPVTGHDRKLYPLNKNVIPPIQKDQSPLNKKVNDNSTSTILQDNKDTVGQDPTSPIPFSEIINYLNEKIGTNYKASTKATKTKINARWQEGFKLDDFKRVIDCKAAAWQYDTKMNQYLRPETLFGTKFESYLNACKSQPDVNLINDLIDIDLTGASAIDYLDYHQTIKDKFPRLYANVRMLKASDYFDLKPGAKRYELLNYRFTVSEIKKNIAKAHQDIEKGLTQGRSYVDVLTELNGLLRQTV
jgi:uncharacterized phage protein (TIGR02220 family)